MYSQGNNKKFAKYCNINSKEKVSVVLVKEKIEEDETKIEKYTH